MVPLDAPDSGMALGIGVMMLCLFSVPVLAAASVGWYVAPKTKRHAKPIGAAAGLIVGFFVGIVIVKIGFGLPWSYFVRW